LYLLTYYLYVDVKEPDWLQFEPADVWILEVTPLIQTQNGPFFAQESFPQWMVES
jgi:hypothetical protein